MFDFFGDVIAFFSWLVKAFSWLFGVLSSFLSALRGGVRAVGQVLEVVERFPAEVTALLLFALAMMVFDYIRGRGK